MHEYRTRYMCMVYIVPDIKTCYNKAIMGEVEAVAVSRAQQKAVSKYMKANYDEIKLRVPKGRKDEIKAHAEARGESVNGFITRAIDETMQRDNIR